MKYGIALGAAHHKFFVEVALEAETLGYESVWLPEHLVLTTQMSRSPHPGEEHPPVPSNSRSTTRSPISRSSPRTEQIRLGTHVYNIGLRHPFTTARGVQTLDIVSGGRVEFGIGASWLEEEWNAVDLDFRVAVGGSTRHRGLQEALDRGRDQPRRRVLHVRAGDVRAQARAEAMAADAHRR